MQPGKEVMSTDVLIIGGGIVAHAEWIVRKR